jgi:hypothetical protein
VSERRLGRVRRALRRSSAPASWWGQLSARLDEQDAAIARLQLALAQAQLALDRRMLDHYALTELALAKMHLRADAIESALSSPDGSVAELLAAESALVDSYLIHHIAELGRELAAGRGMVAPASEEPGPGPGPPHRPPPA